MTIKNLGWTLFLLCLFLNEQLYSQSYYYKNFEPFDKTIPSPEAFLGYAIGNYHTRHDQVVSYLNELANLSDRVSLTSYGTSNENRKLLMLTITSPKNHQNISDIKDKHLQVVNPDRDITNYDNLPIFINLGYNIHGNEPSGTEAALLIAYTLAASENKEVLKYLEDAIIFIDPTINPDGRDRHTNWVNSFRGTPLIADKYDIEHNEGWPKGRTNHYWFDLNRDLLLGVQPESNYRLKWFHEWYPNVVTDFHEMGTNSTFFFEPKQASASLNPITPKENHTTLNNTFARYYESDLNDIGALYFTKERFDATYPGYGSTYGDLQGSLALLFEQASSRGHIQETTTGNISFSFTIRNQFITSISTIKAAVENKDLLYDYQNRFFKSSIEKASKSKTKAYVFGDELDKNRTKAFIDLLLKHKISVYNLDENISIGHKNYISNRAYVVPTKQSQYLMVQTLFESYEQYRDSVFYDASSWSMANFYNMKHSALQKVPKVKHKITEKQNIINLEPLEPSSYAYLIPWEDYNAPAVLYQLQKEGIIVKTATKPFSLKINEELIDFHRGTLLIPVGIQKENSEALHHIINSICNQYKVQSYAAQTGYSTYGIDLGSSNFITIQKPKAMMLVKGSVSPYEAGEVWHLFEQRMGMPISKVPEEIFHQTDLGKYNVIILVSGWYNNLTENNRNKLKSWISEGNTLITIRNASSWAIKKGLVKEKLIAKQIDTSDIDMVRLNYGESREHIGKNYIGGAIVEVDLDITHPLGYGYHARSLPVYKNNQVWIAPSRNRFSTVAKYTQSPHIDGYISSDNMNDYLSDSASIIVSKVGKGRVIMFADNPNFRGSWYGTNKLFLNAVFFGSFIKTP